MSQLDNLTESHKKLFEQMLSRKIEQKNRMFQQDVPFVTVLPKQKYYAASTIQKRMFYLQELDKHSTAYNLPVAFSIGGDLCVQSLRNAFHNLLKRHESLRTGIYFHEGEVVQAVYDDVNFEIEFVQDSNVDIKNTFESFIRPFDLDKPPLIRVKLIKISDQNHLLFLDMHHAISDGKSMSLLLKELASLYEGHTLNVLPIQYKEYADWNARFLNTPISRINYEYWKSQFSEEIPQIAFPSDIMSQNALAYQGSQHYFSMDVSLSEQIKAAAVKEGVTLHTFLLGIYYVLLGKYTQQEDIIVGSSGEGRPFPEFQQVIGAFVTALPLRCKPNGIKSFKNFLEEVQSCIVRASDHQYFSLEELVQFLKKEQYIQDNNLYDVWFELHYDRSILKKFSNLTIEPLQVTHHASKFKLSLEIVDREQSLNCHFEYSSAIFQERTIVRMAKQFERIAAQVVGTPNILIGDLDFIPDEEKDYLVRELNIPAVPFAAPTLSFCEIFNQQVSLRVDAVAATCNGVHLTYKELDNASTHLANHFAALRRPEEQYITFLMERGLPLLIGLIATLKAQMIYTPIDPGAPVDRILNLIDDAAPVLVITDNSAEWIEKFLPGKNNVRNFYEIFGSPASSAPQEPLFSSDHLAYMIFTSGSTGKPKGAMVEHKGMMNHLFCKIHELELNENDVVAQTSSQTFDVSVFQLLIALLVGAKVTIFSHEKAWDPELLLNALEDEKVTVFETVPSHMYLIMEELEHSLVLNSLKEGEADPYDKFFKGKPLAFCHFRWLILNGEPLLGPLCERWQRIYPHVPIINAYGPTECSDDVIHYHVPLALSPLPPRIPIGTVISNMKIYFLDNYMSLVTLGGYGEVYIEGIGVGRGYINDPEKTANAFRPSPFSSKNEPGKRAYYTGDLARYLPSGDIDFLGRRDSQVKIRGQRIELGEIEVTLNRSDMVLQGVVEVKKDNQNELQLVAYIVKKDINIPDNECIERLNQYLIQYLSRHMVPNLFVVLPEMPLLSNGKVNRKALPPPNFVVSENEYLPPRTATEIELATIWCDLLKLSKISRSDHFFRLGGHSLLATQLSARVSRTFDIKFPLKNLFSYPTLESLANEIDKLKQKKQAVVSKEQLPSIVSDIESRYEEFPLTDIQQAYWLGRKGLFALGNVSVHMYCEYECDNLDINRLEQSWNQMIQRHEALRLVFTPGGNQRILKEVPYYSIHVEDFSNRTEKECETEFNRLRQLHSHEVFSSETWPLFLIKAVKLKDNKTRLYLSFDALLLDGWSVDIIFGEWVQLYKNEQTKFELLELSFRDYILSLNKCRMHPLFVEHRDYWLSRLENFPNKPELPLLKSSQEIKNQKFDRVSSILSKQQWQLIQDQLLAKHFSPTGFLAAIFAEVLSRYANSSHFAINLTLFDRIPLHSQINQIAGDFTSLNLLEIDYRKKGSTFADRAKRVQEQLWQDLDHHFFSGVEFSRELAKKRSKQGDEPLFPVVFTSVLGLDNKFNDDVLEMLGKEVFSITQTPQVWLDYKAYEVDGNLILEWDYVEELFAPGFIQEMHEAYVAILKKLVNQPSAWNVQEFQDLISSKQEERFSNYNNTHDIAPPALLHGLFYDQVKLNPKQLAIIGPTDSYTYEELYRSSNQLGHFLRFKGAKPNQLIAVIMEKGSRQVVGCLGILNSGAAYLPIDLSLPTKRIEQILSIGDVSLIVTEQNAVDKLKSIGYVNQLPADRIISLDDQNAQYRHYSDQKLDNIQKTDDLAYVIFTSGSTGIPKGVMIEHGAVSNTILDLNKRYQIRSSDRVLALSSLTFDLSVYDIFGMLAAGGSIVFPESSLIKDPNHWLELLTTHEVTVWNTVPMFMQMLTTVQQKTTERDINIRLRLILLSGDWIPIDLPNQIIQFFGKKDCQIVSLGGATEASIWSIYYDIKRDEYFKKSIPYGRPLTNQQFYVLGEGLEHCPEWVVGDLYIGGIGLARGYWSDPEKTATSFTIHPRFGRIYKTGDLGRLLPSGVIEFLGRNDSQVKLNGHRIELQEIEAKLNLHSDIRQSVVSIATDEAGNKQLVAYVVPEKVVNQSEVQSVENNIHTSIMEFKLQQKARRQFSDENKIMPLQRSFGADYEHYNRKSYRRFENRYLEMNVLENWFAEGLSQFQSNKTNTFFDMGVINQLLEPLRAVKQPNQLLPKYLYPSAGSLYPVQLYIEINEDSLEGLARGSYYYDPLSHQLIQVSSSSSSYRRGVYLYLVGQLSAITPIYGEHGRDFCFIESGHMYALLRNAGQGQVLSTLAFPQQKELYDQLGLNVDDHVFLMGMQFLGSPKEPSFLEINHPDIFLYTKPSKVTGAKSVWHTWNQSKQCFESLSESVAPHISIFSQENYALSQDASFGIFFIEPSGKGKGKTREEYLLYVGAITQMLMSGAIRRNMGICQVGSLDLIPELENLLLPESWLLGLFGGPISDEQMISKEISQPRQSTFDERLAEYLGEHLPKYMVPSTFILLDKLPISSNGKIDRGALPKISFVKVQNRHEEPRNKIESSLLNIWSKVLSMDPQQISTTDVFFEIGGNSLLLISVYNAIYSQLNSKIAIDKLFQYPTIQSLATHLLHADSNSINMEKVNLRASKQAAALKKKRHGGKTHE